MKILGRLSDESILIDGINAAGGAYIVTTPQSVYVESYNGKSVDKCDKFFVVAYAENFKYNIKYLGDKYLSADEANKLVKDLAVKDFIDLDEYEMYFTSVRRFTSIEVANYWDDYDCEDIPLKVTIVADETKTK